MSSGKAAPAGHDVECALCHLPVRSAVARARRVGGRCWRKLRADQRAALTRLTRGGRSTGGDARRAVRRFRGWGTYGVLIGVPGEDVGTVVDAGAVYRAGRATLCGGPDDLLRYEHVFEAWFGARERLPRSIPSEKPRQVRSPLPVGEGGEVGGEDTPEVVSSRTSRR